jgi:hypothetical protein
VGRCTQEERQRACHPFTDSCHPLVAVHNQAVYQKSLSRMLESCQVCGGCVCMRVFACVYVCVCVRVWMNTL